MNGITLSLNNNNNNNNIINSNKDNYNINNNNNNINNNNSDYINNNNNNNKNNNNNTLLLNNSNYNNNKNNININTTKTNTTTTTLNIFKHLLPPIYIYIYIYILVSLLFLTIIIYSSNTSLANENNNNNNNKHSCLKRKGQYGDIEYNTKNGKHCTLLYPVRPMERNKLTDKGENNIKGSPCTFESNMYYQNTESLIGKTIANGKTYLVKCKEGYELSNGGKIEYLCENGTLKDNSVLYNGEVDCVFKGCTLNNIDLIANSTINYNTLSGTFFDTNDNKINESIINEDNRINYKAGNGSTIEANCNSGYYSSNGTLKYTCNNGVWTKTNNSSCIKGCLGAPTDIVANSTINYNSVSGNFYNNSTFAITKPTTSNINSLVASNNSILNVSCNSGYSGSGKYTCTNGSWVKSGACNKNCSATAAANNGYWKNNANNTSVAGKNDIPHGTVISWACNTNYALYKSSMATCNNGNWVWTVNEGVCIDATCGNFGGRTITNAGDTDDTNADTVNTSCCNPSQNKYVSVSKRLMYVIGIDKYYNEGWDKKIIKDKVMAVVSNSSINVDLQCLDLSNTGFRGKNFGNKYIHFALQNGTSTNLTNADFSGATFGNVVFGSNGNSGSNLTNANFSNATFSNNVFFGVNGNSGSNLTNANFSGATFSNNVFFGHSDNSGSNVRSADFRGAKFNGYTYINKSYMCAAMFDTITNFTTTGATPGRCSDDASSNGNNCSGHMTTTGTCQYFFD